MGQNFGLNLSDYDFNLPENLIAQSPINDRDKSRLLIYDTTSDTILHKKFYEIIEYFNDTSILAFNTSKVIPVRLTGYKEISKGSVNITLIEELSHDKDGIDFRVLTIISKLRNTKKICFKDGLTADIVRREDDMLVLRFNCNKEFFYSFINKFGKAPLPPYIKRESKDVKSSEDLTRYQTVYADTDGSVAAPTAGMHFSDHVINEIRGKGTILAPLVLHVGMGTFLPVKKSNIIEHKMLGESYKISLETKKLLDEAALGKYNLTSVGTTSTRTIESYFITGKAQDKTELYIYPGHSFNIDRLITNFHVPHSTPLLLVSAFIADKRRKMGDADHIENSVNILKKIYKEAIALKYRFYSYGDSMFIQ